MTTTETTEPPSSSGMVHSATVAGTGEVRAHGTDPAVSAHA